MPSARIALPFAPLVYDLSIRARPRGPRVPGAGRPCVRRAAGDRGRAPGFTARVVPTTDPPPKAGQRGRVLRERRGRAQPPGDVPDRRGKFRRFDSTITLHAVEYVAARGLRRPSRGPRRHPRPRRSRGLAIIPMSPVPTTVKVVFAATPPPATRSRRSRSRWTRPAGSARPVARIAPGAPLADRDRRRRALRGARARHAGGAISDSGRSPLQPVRPNVTAASSRARCRPRRRSTTRAVAWPGDQHPRPDDLDNGGVLAAASPRADRAAFEPVTEPRPSYVCSRRHA